MIRLNIHLTKNNYPLIYINGLPGISTDIAVSLRQTRQNDFGIAISWNPKPALITDDIILDYLTDLIDADPTWDNVYAHALATPKHRAPASHTYTPNRYGGRETFHDLSIDMRTNWIPEETTIFVDSREPSIFVRFLSEVTNLRPRTATLEIGDFFVEGRIVIERKTNVDLAQSIQDHRVFQQMERMRTIPEQSWLILEGDPYEGHSLEIKNIDGFVVNVGNRDTRLLHSKNMRHTASLIAKIVRHSYGLGTPDPALTPASKSQDPAIATTWMLSQIPHLSVTIAERLIERFGSIANICTATPNDLTSVDGIGPTLITTIGQVLHGLPTPPKTNKKPTGKPRRSTRSAASVTAP